MNIWGYLIQKQEYQHLVLIIKQTTNLKIRRAHTSDLAEMQQLFSETISTICKDDYDPEQLEMWISSVENKDRWIDKIKEQYFIVAERDNKMVGYGSLDNGAYLDFMYVHKDFQRQGIAQSLLSELENEARNKGASEITSDVSKTARIFFERNGFRAKKENIVQIKGIEIINYKMTKKL